MRMRAIAITGIVFIFTGSLFAETNHHSTEDWLRMRDHDTENPNALEPDLYSICGLRRPTPESDITLPPVKEPGLPTDHGDTDIPLEGDDANLLGPVPSGINLTKEEEQIVIETNRLRKKAELPLVRLSSKLTRQCRSEAERIAGNSDLSMSDHSGVQNASENIGLGLADGTAAADLWSTHPGHKENLYDADKIFIGVGVSSNGRGFCQEFSNPQLIKQ